MEESSESDDDDEEEEEIVESAAASGAASSASAQEATASHHAAKIRVPEPPAGGVPPGPPGSADDLVNTILEQEFTAYVKEFRFSASLRDVFFALKKCLEPIWESGRVARLTPENVMLDCWSMD